MIRPAGSTRFARAATLVALLLGVTPVSLVARASAGATLDPPGIRQALKAGPAYDAAFVSQDLPSFIGLYAPTPVSVTMRNTGTATWHRAEADVFLATAEPQDNYYPGVLVTTAAEFVSQQVPDIVPAKAAFQVSVEFRNTTNATWTPEEGCALVPAGPAGNATWDVASAPLAETVEPGAAVTLTFHATAPEVVGRHVFQRRMSSRERAACGRTSPASLVDVVSAGPANRGGLWWASPAGVESGWGIDLAHRGGVVFAASFTYEDAGKAPWLTMTANWTRSGAYVGTLHRTSGPSFDAATCGTRPVRYTAVGTGALAFTDANNGSFTSRCATWRERRRSRSRAGCSVRCRVARSIAIPTSRRPATTRTSGGPRRRGPKQGGESI